jgi:hypothetical protein
MNGVATKIAQEIRVLFDHQHFDARAREQEAGHYSRRPAARDAALDRKLLGGHLPALFRQMNCGAAGLARGAPIR